jgi:hypothetical protein
MPAREDSPWDTNAVTAAAEVAALAKNKAAYTHLGNCMMTSRDMGYVCCYISEAWPYASQTWSKGSPLDLFVKIVEIKAQYKLATYTIDHHLIVSTVLRASPLHYKLQVGHYCVAGGARKRYYH